MIVMANDVKKRGVSLFTELLNRFDEVIISVRGKSRYAVIDIERYEELRALELEKTYHNVQAEIESGKVQTLTAEQHLADIRNEL